MNQNLLKLLFITVMSASVGWSYAQTDNWSDHPEELSPTGNTYTVSTPGELAWLANQVNGGNPLESVTIVLDNDLDLAGHNWVPIGKDADTPFSGSFDGGGHTISNMNILIETSEPTAYGGLFGFVSKGGDLKNIGITSGSISVTALNEALAGAIVGNMVNSGSIENCYSTIDITTEITDPTNSKEYSPRAGGIVGNYTNSPRTGKEAIRYCYSTGVIRSLGTQAATTNGIVAGGIAGRIEDVTVEYCYSTGTIRTEGGDTPYAGGIIGHSSYLTHIQNCYSSADVTAISTRAADCYAIAGGISATLSRGIIENCYATGTITAENKAATTDGSEVYAGGIVGDLFVGGKVGNETVTSTVRNCLALNKSLSATTNMPTSRVCLNKVVGGYNTNASNTLLGNNYAAIPTKVLDVNILATNDLNGANWTGDELISSVFTDANGWLTNTGKLPVLKTSTSSDALGGQTGMETASLLPPSEVTIGTAEDITAALNVDNIKSIRLANGTYELQDPLKINKSIDIIGSSPDACTLSIKCVISPTTPATITLQGLTLTEEESNTPTSLTMIEIKTPVELALRNVVIDPKQPGTDDRRAMIELTDKVTSSTITLDNTTIYLTKNSQIGLYNQGGACDFRMTDSKITSKQNIDNLSAIRGMLIKGAPNSTYTIERSTVSVGNNFHYAIWVQTPEQHFTINNSDIYGWAAFYIQGAHREGGSDGITLEATKSTFTGVGKEGSSNGFGVIVFEATAHSSVNLEDCTVTNKIIEETKDYGFIPPFVFQMGGAGSVTDRLSLKPSSECTVTLTKCTIQNQAEKTTPAFIYYGNVFGDLINGYRDYNKNKVSIDTNTRFLNQDGTSSFLVQNHDTIRNATSSLPHAIAYQDGKNVIPIAYPGDVIKANGTTLQKALELLNEADAVPADYVLPDSILIECKGGYLVSSLSAANSYAGKLKDAPVFYLKRDKNVFSTQAAGDNRVTIAFTSTWNDAKYANRSVWVKAGATLKINAAMPLDTLFMEEGAQVKAEVDATVRTLQLVRDTIRANQWKAFGFPVENADQMAVTDSEDKAVEVSDKSQDGVWFAGLGDTPATFAHKSEWDVAGLIAAQKEQVITVTSKTTQVLSLKKKDEPSAPSGESTFTLIANPNTFNMTLSQTAYVLSDDGKYYERKENPTIPAFSSFILADAQTTATLRSFELKDDTPTANAVSPTSGYFVTTRQGVLVIHTSEPVHVTIATMKGQLLYNGTVSTDGWQLAVPAGIYAVNGELFQVK